MDELLRRFKARLDDLGVTAKIGSALPARRGAHAVNVRLTRGASTQEYTLTYGLAVKLADTGRTDDANVPRLVFTTFVAPTSAETFRRAGVQYLDTAGNAWVTFGDVLVDVRGQRRPVGADQPAHASTGNLFSTARARVTFALLAWPQLWKAPQRTLAHAAGVSLGQAHNTLIMLTEAGYGPDRAHPAQAELLDLWAAAFATGLAKKLTLATYRGDIDAVQTVNADHRVFLSGESAVDDQLRPATLTLYVEELDPRLPVVNKWRSDGPPNIVVRRTFWRAPDSSDSPPDGVHPAPRPLVYADLLTSDDPRVRTVAKEWRDRLVGHDQGS
ncbi:MAG: type IV toxin-antitoxin system AbiEi family antitoxin [Nocardioidaceae bacterium]